MSGKNFSYLKIHKVQAERRGKHTQYNGNTAVLNCFFRKLFETEMHKKLFRGFFDDSFYG